MFCAFEGGCENFHRTFPPPPPAIIVDNSLTKLHAAHQMQDLNFIFKMAGLKHHMHTST